LPCFISITIYRIKIPIPVAEEPAKKTTKKAATPKAEKEEAAPKAKAKKAVKKEN
jgi:hypothetical protein